MSDLATLKALEAQLEAALETVRGMEAEVTSAPVPTPTPAPATADASFAFNDYGKFYDYLRGNKMLGPKISADEFGGCDAILKACTAVSWPVGFSAYALATAYLETAHTMQPINEYGGTAYFTRMYDIQGSRPDKAKELGNLAPGDGAKYHGRGYVQLTGKKNYLKAEDVMKSMGIPVDLSADPDLALRPDVAAAVMVEGMGDGWFTGRKLSQTLPLRGPASLAQFVVSRSIINGHDREADVAGYAVDFQTALQAGGYRIAA